MTMPAGFDQRIHGSRPAPSDRPVRELEERERRAKLEAALEVMRTASARRHAEVDAALRAICAAIGLDPERVVSLGWARAEVSTLLHHLKQS